MHSATQESHKIWNIHGINFQKRNTQLICNNNKRKYNALLPEFEIGCTSITFKKSKSHPPRQFTKLYFKGKHKNYNINLNKKSMNP